MDKDLIVPKTTAKKGPTAKTKPAAKAKLTKKAAVKKTKPAAAKVVNKKSSPKKAPVNKAPAKKNPAKKAETKKTTAPKQPAAKIIPAEKAKVNGAIINGRKPDPKVAKAAKGKPLTKRELKKYEKILMELRERLQGDIRFLTTDNLHRAGRETGADLSGSAQHSADHGTDNFDREFALSLASTEQDVLYEVDEALMRIYEGEYGICAMTGVQIERARLEIIPYTRYSVQAQSKMEQSRARYRPFAQTFKGW